MDNKVTSANDSDANGAKVKMACIYNVHESPKNGLNTMFEPFLFFII